VLKKVADYMNNQFHFPSLLLIFFCGGIAVNCSTQESLGPSSCYLSTVHFEATQITVTYLYDGNNRIISSQQVNGKTNTTTTSDYSYDNNNRVSSITHSSGEKDTYTYDAEGKVTSRTVSDNTGYGLSETFFYNESNQLMRKENYSVAGVNKTLVQVTDYEYPNSSMRNPSLVTVSLGSGASSTVVLTSEYTYDNKNTPPSLTTLSPEATTNNVIEVTCTYSNAQPTTSTFSYTYNAKGYPVKSVHTTSEGSYTTSFTYTNCN
jgi:YD repeat-containing protein